MLLKSLLFATSFAATAIATMAHADNFYNYSPAQLAGQAEDFVAAQFAFSGPDDRIEVNASNLDSRMGDRGCEQPLDLSLATNATLERQTTVMLACNGTENWRLYIPVRIQHMSPVVVSARPLAAGQVIGREDVKISYVDINQLRDSAHSDIEDILGAQVRRRIGINQPVVARHTCFVCRGHDVTIISGVKGLEVRATGTARTDGLLGERITVRNSRSNKDVQAVVTGTNEVRTGF